MLRQKGYEHTHTNPEKSETTARQQSKNADKTRIFAKEKPKPNTFVFDLGFTWRKVRDSNPRTPFRASFDFKSSAFNRALPTFRKQLNYNKIFSLNQANRKGARKLRD